MCGIGRAAGGCRLARSGGDPRLSAMRTFIPATGHHHVSRAFYDPITKLLGADRARAALVAQARLAPGQRVLDIGCGTGTLAVEIKSRHPGVEVVGLDPDPEALAIARRKAERAGVSIRFDQGFADELPYADASFDRVFSSFMLHHLAPDAKARALREVRRVLGPRGSLHLVDFEPQRSGLARRLPWNRHSGDNTEANVLSWLRDAGLADSTRVEGRSGFLSRLGYYRAASLDDRAAAGR